MVVGPSGAGKTSTILFGTLNAIARGNSSCVVLDPSKEIYDQFSGYLSKTHRIFSIDLSNTSDGYNPLHSSKPSDIAKIASTLIQNSGVESKSDKYWSASAEKLLTVFIQYVMEYAPPQTRSLASVASMLDVFSAEPDKIDRLFANTNDELLTKYKSIISVGDKTLSSTVSTASVALRVFSIPEVARCTAHSTFNFEDFRRERSILFLNAPITMLPVLAPFNALLFSQLFDMILSRIPKPGEAKVYAILDEMASMRIEHLGLVYANVRKFSGAVMGIIQSLEMLNMHCSPAEAHAILSNSYSKIHLPGQNHQTCKMLEDMIGRDEHNKPVMTAAQIRMSPEAIIIVGNNKPYLEKMIPFYDHWLLKHRAQIPPYKQERKIPFDTPPLIQF